jgi:hypothetical protein
VVSQSELAHVITKHVFQYDRVMRQLMYGRRRRQLESFHEQYEHQRLRWIIIMDMDAPLGFIDSPSRAVI